MPERLPSNDYPLGSNEHTAYQSCLVLEGLGSSWGVVISNLEKEASEAVMFKFSPQVAARVLGYALRHSPSVEGKAHLVQEILNCNNNGELLAGLSYLYVMGMIRVFKNPKGSVLTSLSSHSSRASFRATADNIAAALAQPTVSSSKAKDLALARDNHRCIVSGIVDLVSYEEDPMRFNEAPEVTAGTTSLGHIFGQSIMDHTAGMTRAARAKVRLPPYECSIIRSQFACQMEWATTAAAVIERFAGIPILEEFNQNDIHRPENTFTIADGLHPAFDRLSFSLCPIDDDNNTYEIHTHPPNRNATYRLPNRVTLTDATNGKIPLPDRRYFQLHHACATIAHLSGAGEVVEQLFRDMEDIKVLAEDGGSNHLLSLALSSRLQALSVY
ncbi:hypothetical protein EDD18DRAFT_1257547 [Armillaria luteobubalina]|uniref:HNH nuclease domain-containing protein n=1 Tax=Armillaria luteobubalina TaxID=153913 RepID=A0AA39PZB3_9AGAR|nr:hypothetical protein EDD18DRAFT_1257547 [Armillaria luteobubalina]